MAIEYKTYAKCLKVLSDETRLEIMDLLSEGEMCACALLDQFSITQPTLSYHMKMMKDCGLVDSRKDGIWVKYSVNHEKLDELKDFFQTMANKTPLYNHSKAGDGNGDGNQNFGTGLPELREIASQYS